MPALSSTRANIRRTIDETEGRMRAMSADIRNTIVLTHRTIAQSREVLQAADRLLANDGRVFVTPVPI